MRRAVVQSLPEAIHMRGVQAGGIETYPGAAADGLAKGQGAVIDGVIRLSCCKVPHRPGAVTNATAAPLIVHVPLVVALVEVAFHAGDAAVRPHVKPAAVR